MDPHLDVFVLKLDKHHGVLKNSLIELELRTPKSPTADIPKGTQFAQTYEEDFSEAYTGNKKPVAAKSKKK